MKGEYGTLLQEYVGRIYKACGEGQDVIVILKHAKQREAIRKILEKCNVNQTISGVLTTGTYKDKEFSISITGKLILKGIEAENEAEEILKELFS